MDFPPIRDDLGDFGDYGSMGTTSFSFDNFSLEGVKRSLEKLVHGLLLLLELQRQLVLAMEPLLVHLNFL